MIFFRQSCAEGRQCARRRNCPSGSDDGDGVCGAAFFAFLARYTTVLFSGQISYGDLSRYLRSARGIRLWHHGRAGGCGRRVWAFFKLERRRMLAIYGVRGWARPRDSLEQETGLFVCTM